MSKDRNSMEDWVTEQIEELTNSQTRTLDEHYVRWMCRHCFLMGRTAGLRVLGEDATEEVAG